MNTQQKQLNLLGLSQRAGLLVTGDELVTQAVKSGQAKLVLCANDVSTSTRERVSGLCDRRGVPYRMNLTSDQISQSIGKLRKVVAITDRGMADKYLSYETGEVPMYDK